MKLDVNRTPIRHQLRLRCRGSLALRFKRTRHADRKQRCISVRQFTPFPGAAPLEHLVRVHSMISRNLRHAGSRLHRQLHNLTLLRGASPTANTSNLAHTRLHHGAIFNQDQQQSPEGHGVRLRRFCTPAHRSRHSMTARYEGRLPGGRSVGMSIMEQEVGFM